MDNKFKEFLLNISSMSGSDINQTESISNILKEISQLDADSIDGIILDEINHELHHILQSPSGFQGVVNIFTYLTFFTEIDTSHLNYIKNNINYIESENDKKYQNNIANMNLCALLCGENFKDKIKKAIEMNFPIYQLHKSDNLLREFITHKSLFNNAQMLSDFQFIIDNIPEDEKCNFHNMQVKLPQGNTFEPFSILFYIMTTRNHSVASTLLKSFSPHFKKSDIKSILDIVSGKMTLECEYGPAEDNRIQTLMNNISIAVKSGVSLNPFENGNSSEEVYLVRILEYFLSQEQLDQFVKKHEKHIDFISCLTGYMKYFFSFDEQDNHNSISIRYEEHLSLLSYVNAVKEVRDIYKNHPALEKFDDKFFKPALLKEKEILSNSIHAEEINFKVKRL